MQDNFRALINHLVHVQFPQDKIVGEEDSGELVGNPDLLKNVQELVNEHIPNNLSLEEVLSMLILPRS